MRTPRPIRWQYGFGVRFFGGDAVCVDATHYTGVRFTIAGDLGSCGLTFSAVPRQDQSESDGGACAAATCLAPRSGPVGVGTTTVRFSEMSGGSPLATVDPSTLAALQWTLDVPAGADAGQCRANLRISDVAFVRD